jgi:hypothetical protein
MVMKTKTYFFITFFFLSASLSELQMMAQPVCPTPLVNLGEDTHICPGSSLYLDAGLHQNTLWNDGSTDRYFLVSEPGVYFVWVENECGATNADTIIIELAENPEVAFIMPEGEYFCKGEQINVTANVTNTDGSILYEWVNRDSNDPTLVVDTTGNYEVKATNEYGCETTREVNIEFQYPYEEEKILLASYDPETNKNFIVWSRTPEKRTQSYILINGNTQDNVFAEASFRNQNIFVDEKSEPLVRSSYYNIMLKDSCNNTSSFRMENAHRTMYLTTSTDADGNAMLEWQGYLGFEYDKFYILRGQDPGRMEVLDSVAYIAGQEKQFYSDLSAEKDIVYYYTIKVKTPEIIYLDNPDSRKAGSGPFVHSLSNLEDNLIKSTHADELKIIEQYLRVYPNPFNGFATIRFKLEEKHHINLTLYDLSGVEVRKIMDSPQYGGEVIIDINTNDFYLQPGVYILQMQVDNNYLITRKLVSQ